MNNSKRILISLFLIFSATTQSINAQGFSAEQIMEKSHHRILYKGESKKITKNLNVNPKTIYNWMNEY